MLEEKNDIKKIVSDVSIVTRNNEKKVPAKKRDLGWVRGVSLVQIDINSLM